MEKQSEDRDWEIFCQSGRVEDYLTYYRNRKDAKEECKEDGTVRDSDGDGAIGHAHIGI